MLDILLPNVVITRQTAKPKPSPSKTSQRFGRVDVLLGDLARGCNTAYIMRLRPHIRQLSVAEE